MSYGDYGAYIWKNGKNMTKKCADKSYILIEDKWYDAELLEDVDTSKCLRAGGHAVLVFDKFIIEFYKVYNPKIILNNGKEIRPMIIGKSKGYRNKNLDLGIVASMMNSNDNICEFIVEQGEDVYSIIIGSAMGNGWDKTNISKFIKKYQYYDKDTKRYYIKHKWIEKTDCWSVLDYLERKDDIRFQKQYRWEYGYKRLFYDLIHFKFNYLPYDCSNISEYNTRIKMLK